MTRCDVKLSILIPTYNRRLVLEEMLQSLFVQLGGLPVEVIIIDDCSSDDTWDWLQTTYADRTNVVCLRSAANGGPGPARNLGLLVARGEYFVPFDSDFIVIDGAIQHILEGINTQRAYRMLFFPCLQQPGGGRLDSLAGRREITYLPYLKYDLGELIPVVDLSHLRSRGLAYPPLRAGGEGILWARLLADIPALFIDSPVVYYRTDVSQRICTLEYQLAHPRELAEVAESMLGLYLRPGLESARARKLLAAGTYHLLAGNTRVARQRLMSALAHRQVVALIALASSLVGRRGVRALFRLYRAHIGGAYLSATTSGGSSGPGNRHQPGRESASSPGSPVVVRARARRPSLKSRYLVRFDDICPTMRWDIWDLIEDYLLATGIRPLLAVIPQNQDRSLEFAAPNPRFWERVRSWQARGWSIGLHGFRHEFVSRDSGILGVNPFSEFAGLSLEEQTRKICAGLEVFRREGVKPDAWIAPAHSFDKHTIQALLAAGIRTISDGFSLYPYRDRDGILWVPQQLWHFRTIPIGVWTVCMHHNTWEKVQFDVFRAQAERRLRSLTSLQELQAAYGNRKKQFGDRLADGMISPVVRRRAEAMNID